jgi:hypothetical protein
VSYVQQVVRDRVERDAATIGAASRRNAQEAI